MNICFGLHGKSPPFHPTGWGLLELCFEASWIQVCLLKIFRLEMFGPPFAISPRVRPISLHMPRAARQKFWAQTGG